MQILPRVSLLLLVATMSLPGCSANAPETVTPPPAKQMLHVALEEIDKAGEVGSVSEELPRLVAEIKATEPEKGAALEKDLEALLAARGAPAVKAKAKSMSKTLAN